MIGKYLPSFIRTPVEEQPGFQVLCKHSSLLEAGGHAPAPGRGARLRRTGNPQFPVVTALLSEF
jgi:hypothetical protein